MTSAGQAIGNVFARLEEAREERIKLFAADLWEAMLHTDIYAEPREKVMQTARRLTDLGYKRLGS